MYTEVQRWGFIHQYLSQTDLLLETSWSESRRSWLAGGQALTRLQPLDESGFRITDRATDTDVGRPVAAHARFREPGRAHFQAYASFLGGKER